MVISLRLHRERGIGLTAGCATNGLSSARPFSKSLPIMPSMSKEQVMIFGKIGTLPWHRPGHAVVSPPRGAGELYDVVRLEGLAHVELHPHLRAGSESMISRLPLPRSCRPRTHRPPRAARAPL